MNMRQLRKLVESQGFTWNISRGTAHIIVRNPAGARVASLSGSPSSGRSLDHSIADLRRGGVKIPRKGQK
jgi:hypothetical protein